MVCFIPVTDNLGVVITARPQRSEYCEENDSTTAARGADRIYCCRGYWTTTAKALSHTVVYAGIRRLMTLFYEVDSTEDRWRSRLFFMTELWEVFRSGCTVFSGDSRACCGNAQVNAAQDASGIRGRGRGRDESGDAGNYLLIKGVG